MLQDLIRAKEEVIVLRNRLYADAKQWDELRQKDSQRANGELWSGSKLERIVELKNNDSLPNLDDVALKFIAASVERSERQKNERVRTARKIAAGSLVAVVVSSGLGLMAWNKTREAELNRANSLGRYSQSLFSEHKELEAFVEAIRAGRILQHQHANDPEVMIALQQAIYEGSERNRLEGHNNYVNSVSFSPDGKTLASGSLDRTIKLWNRETGQEIRTLAGHNKEVLSVSFSPDGKTLASGSVDRTIKLWNRETGQEIRTLRGHNDVVHSVSFSPDGKTLASGSVDRTIKLWNRETGQEIRTLRGHNDVVHSVSFSPDGKTLASGSVDRTIKLWNLETGQEIYTLTGHNDAVWSVSFSPDGKTLASGSDDSTIKLWNLETGQEIYTLTGHNSVVNSVSFSPDGKTLASGSCDSTIKLWNGNNGWDLDALMERSCDKIRNYLTYNPNVSESDKHLCDSIGTPK
nr:WD40 repeat domain-containing protein [Merismopedia glauca]